MHSTSLTPGTEGASRQRGSGGRPVPGQEGNGPRLSQGEAGGGSPLGTSNQALPASTNPEVHCSSRGCKPGLPATCLCKQSFSGTQPHPSCTYPPGLRGPQSLKYLPSSSLQETFANSALEACSEGTSEGLGCTQEALTRHPTPGDPAPGSGAGPRMPRCDWLERAT